MANNSIGTNGAYGGRTSVNALNDGLAIYEAQGVISGFQISPNAGMTIAIGGSGLVRDVAIAQDNLGNRTTIDNITQQPIILTIPAAPAANARIDSIVAYVNNPPQGEATVIDNPGACGLIVASGNISASPVAPDESAIRTAITTAGASGSTAYYVELGQVTVESGTTDITANMITQGKLVKIAENKLDITSVGNGKITIQAGGTGAGSSMSFNVNQKNDTTWKPVLGHDNIGANAVQANNIADNAVGITEIYFGEQGVWSNIKMMYGLVVRARKWGRLVFLTMSSFTTSSMPNTGTSSETLPEHLRPTVSVDTVFRCSLNNMAGKFSIGTNGKIFWWFGTAPGKGSELTASISYIAQDSYY